LDSSSLISSLLNDPMAPPGSTGTGSGLHGRADAGGGKPQQGLVPQLKDMWNSHETGGTGTREAQNANTQAVLGQFADGGDPPVGQPALVGENGPELIVPKMPTTVIPNSQLNQYGIPTGGLKDLNQAPSAASAPTAPVPPNPSGLTDMVPHNDPVKTLENSLMQRINKYENPDPPHGFWQTLGHGLAQTGLWQNTATEKIKRGQEAEREKTLGTLLQRDAGMANADSLAGLRAAQEKYNDAHANAVDLHTITSAEAQAMGHPEMAGQQATQTVFQHLMTNKNTADIAGNKNLAGLAEHGLKMDAQGKIVEDPDSPYIKDQKIKQDYIEAGEELRDAQAALDKAKADPNNPAYTQAAQRLNIAQQRLALSQATYAARYKGTDASGSALPGAMLLPDGTPVGTTNSVNVRPTGQERNKGDMASSAETQINDMLSIVKKHSEFFGPGAGRWTAFQQWLGSQAPDAQRFATARTIAGDHLAGTFGGRSEAALAALDAAIGHFKDNPQSVEAGLKQLTGANSLFKEKGTVHTASGWSAPHDAPAAPKADNKYLYDSKGTPIAKSKGGKWAKP
jgi:hypothetical protein